MQPLPNQISPFTNKDKIIPPWNSYLQQFTQAPPVISDVTVTTSPFGYVAREPGHVAVQGGTVSLIRLIRGTTAITIVGNIVPVGINDTVEVTYSVLPTVSFIPMYGNAPR